MPVIPTSPTRLLISLQGRSLQLSWTTSSQQKFIRVYTRIIIVCGLHPRVATSKCSTIENRNANDMSSSALDFGWRWGVFFVGTCDRVFTAGMQPNDTTGAMVFSKHVNVLPDWTEQQCTKHPTPSWTALVLAAAGIVMARSPPAHALARAGEALVLLYVGFLLYLLTQTPHDARQAIKVCVKPTDKYTKMIQTKAIL